MNPDDKFDSSDLLSRTRTKRWIPRGATHVVSHTLCPYTCTMALLTLWDRPWSGTALRFAYHALLRALAHGLDVMETQPPD